MAVKVIGFILLSLLAIYFMLSVAGLILGIIQKRRFKQLQTVEPDDEDGSPSSDDSADVNLNKEDDGNGYSD